MEAEVAREEEHSKFFWLCRRLINGLGAYLKKHIYFFLFFFTAVIIAFFLLRAAIHPYVLAIRTRMFLVVVGAPIAFFAWRMLFYGRWLRRLLIASVCIPLFSALSFWGDEIHEYLSLYYRFISVKKVEINLLPITDFERIQPLNSVYSLAFEAMSETENPTLPDLVRVGNEYRWTLAIEPAYPIPRLLLGVREIFSVSAISASPNFVKSNRIAVNFPVGESLLYGRNAFTAAIRSFGIRRYLNYEPTDVVYVTDNNGEWVEVVSLVRWRGIFFPRPEFGGVQVIRQYKGSSVEDLRLILLGVGDWIPPERIQEYPFLAGQNIMSYAVSRYIANSFRFHKGFLGPLPGYHRGDIRISNRAEDVNDQPFTVFFSSISGRKGMLYHYFALEPFDPDKQGLNTSLFIPADGSDPVYFYRHHDRGYTLTGVSAISPKVMESRKMYDWNKNRPVEHRPFIKEIDGKIRFFWLTTAITFKEQENGQQNRQGKRFIAGALPELAITDAVYNIPVWVDPNAPDNWINTIKHELRSIWQKYES